MAKPPKPTLDGYLAVAPVPATWDETAAFPTPAASDHPSPAASPEAWNETTEASAQAADEVPAAEHLPAAREEPAAKPEPFAPVETPAESPAPFFDEPAAAEPAPLAWEAVDAAAEPSFAEDSPTPEPASYTWETLDEEQASPDAEAVPADSPLLPALGRRSLYKHVDAIPSTREELANVIDYLQALQTRIGDAELAAATQAPPAPGLTLLQAKRLSRSGVAPNPFEIGVLPRPPADRPVETGIADESTRALPPVVSQPPPPVADAPPAGVRFERRHAVWLLLTGALSLVTLGLVAYLWTRVGPAARAAVPSVNPAPHAAVDPAENTRASDEALALASQALDAIRRNDLPAASEILSDARRKGMVLPGVYYQAALLTYSQGQEMAADALIDQSILAHEAVPECWYLRANSLFYTMGPDKAAEAFDEAVRAAPFSPRFYFFWGECLRRNGNVAAALAQFEQALRCRPDSADRDLILFKAGLTRIESNTDTAFTDKLRERLSQPPVAGDTLLLAAAEEIGRAAYPEAAEHIRQAAGCLPPAIFQSLTRDFVFKAEVRRPEIAAALRIPAPAGTPGPAPRPVPRTLIDPATRSLAEADPGAW